MRINLKLVKMRDLENLDLVEAIDDGTYNKVKLTTNSLKIEKDRDQRFLKSIKNMKIVINLEEGCLILKGHFGNSFANPFGGELFVTKATLVRSCNFKKAVGVECEILFTNNPSSIEDMRVIMASLVENEDFAFNMKQFEDFMEVFTFYKDISDELNNSATFTINSISSSYYSIPIYVKELKGLDGELLSEYRGLEEISDSSDILKGFKVSNSIYDLMPNNIKEKVIEVVDIDVSKEDNQLKMMRKMHDNVYMSNHREVTKSNARNLVNINVINYVRTSKSLILSVELPKDMNYKFLNLYDMGQKVKVDSIEESLKLIHQGNSGSAINLISYLIGDTPMPSISSEKRSNTSPYIKGLNESQKKAFLKAIDGSPVTLIKGPPGTGKTHVINAITQYITKEMNEKVVISSQTHVAIDNVLDKLMENHDLVIPNRITNRRDKYSGDEIDLTLYKTWGRKFEKHNRLVTNRTLAKKVLNEMNHFDGDARFRYSHYVTESDFSVLGATTTTSAIAGKKGTELLKEYSWLIIDEVSKCPITEVLRYLPYIEKIIMVGDDYQLAPLIEFTKEQVKDLPSYDDEKFEILKSVYEKSVFADTMKKARQADRLVELDVNYRSVPDVLNAYNIFYDFSLKSKRLEVNPDIVEFTDKLDYLNDNDIAFVYVRGGREATDQKTVSKFNLEELDATRDVLSSLIENTLNPGTVSVSAIFPYSAQIARFTKENKELINKAKRVFSSFEADTIDAFQGKESDIVLVNTVITDSSKRNFMSDFKRINVAMSRAKDKLIVFGNADTLSKLDMSVYDGSKRKYFKDILDDIRRKGIRIEYNHVGGVSIETPSKAKTKIKKAK